MSDSTYPTNFTAIVTGCGAPRGIGRAVARELLIAGWNLAVSDITPHATDFAAELKEYFPDRRILGLQFDVSSPTDVHEAYAMIDAKLPPVAGLVNAAGIACPTTLMDIEVEEFDRVMEVNCRGTMLMMQHSARRMRDQRIGRIVNFSSITALDGGGTFSKSTYAAAKAAVIGLTRGGARELGPFGITCNVLLPGPIDTDIMGGKLTQERKVAMSESIPVGRVGKPSEVGAVVRFLLSLEASFVTGTSINVDGGKHMH